MSGKTTQRVFLKVCRKIMIVVVAAVVVTTTYTIHKNQPVVNATDNINILGNGDTSDPFNSLVDARINVDTSGEYNFDVSGEIFSTFVDDEGWILVASGDGDTAEAAYTQTSNLTQSSDAILNPDIINAINAIELKLTSESGSVDLITTNHENLALFDNYKNIGSGSQSQSEWTGTGQNLLGSSELKNTSSLNEVIFDSGGEAGKLHWAPQNGLENPSGSDASGNEDMHLWARGGASELLSVPTSVTGNEDENIPLNIIADPTIIEGGAHQDIIATDGGFRLATDGSNPTSFSIPAQTRFAKITAYGGNDGGTGSATEEDYQTMSMIVDLSRNTYSGHIFHVRNQSSEDNDDYSFSDIALGDSSDSDSVVGDNDDDINSVNLSKIGNNLSLVESQDLVDQAYFVEYYSNATSSLNFLGSQSDYLSPNETASSIDLDTSSNLVVVSIADGRGSGNSFQEDKALARIVVDLDSDLASGVFFAQIGRGSDNTAAYTFSDYDITSTQSILLSANLDGDIIANTESLPDWTLQKTLGGIDLSRSNGMAGSFNSLINFDSYERVQVGSNASILGTSQLSQNYIDDISAPNYFDLSLPGSAATGSITLHMTNIAGLNVENENSGIANIYVDLENETTSGNFMVMRTTIPDLVAWSDVPFGERVIDHSNTTTNRQTIFHFIDEMAGVLSFDTETLSSGEKVLRATAEAVRGDGSSQFDNFLVTMQSVWSGRSAVEISGIPTGGSFNVGSFDPQTGQYNIDPEDTEMVEFIPDENFSGIGNITLIVSYNGESHNMNIEVVRVADEPSLVLQDATGLKESYFDISDRIEVELVDTDGSETISLLEVDSIPVGHRLRDGTNEFISIDGTQSIDIKDWNLDQLEYYALEGGEFSLDIVAQSTDTDNFSPTDDSAQVSDQLTISIPSVEVNPEASLSISEGASGEGYEVALSLQPISDVVIEVQSSDEGAASLSTDRLVFTPSNWDQVQSVTVSPVSDDDSVDETVTISFEVLNSESDAEFHDLNSVKTVLIQDDDTSSIEVTGPSEIDEGSNGQLAVSLATQPLEDVTLDISLSNSEVLNLDNNELTFSSESWNIEQYIIVSSPENSIDEDESITLELQVDDSASDDSYDGIIEGFILAIRSIDESLIDSDSDFVPDEVEQAGPNGGDANGDGQLDYLQSNVATKVGEVSSEYISLETAGECQNITKFEMRTEADLPNQDGLGSFVIGLHDFELECFSNGQSAEITMIWDKEYDTSEWVYRKYIDESFVTMSDQVSYGTKLIDGETKTTSTFSIVDGGDLDSDGESNGIIVDPAGPLMIVSESLQQPDSLIRTGGK